MSISNAIHNYQLCELARGFELENVSRPKRSNATEFPFSIERFAVSGWRDLH